MATYRAKQVQVTYGEIGITGFAEGTFVKVMVEKETFAKSMGSDGEGCFVQEHDRSGSIEFTLHQASPANALLMAKFNAQRDGSAGPLTAIVRDLNGNYKGQAVGYLAKDADTERSNTTTNMVWKVVSLKVDQEGGGVTQQ
jgi:hypothetical protein